jgi:WD40 repeat protein
MLYEPPKGVTALAVSNEMLIAGYLDCTISIWDLKTNTCQITLSGHTESRWRYGIGSLIIVDGRLISSAIGHAIKIWDLKTKTFIGHLELGRGFAGCFAVSNGMLYHCHEQGISILDFNADHITIFEELANLLESAHVDDLFEEQNVLNRFSRMPKVAKNAIYGELYKILNSLNPFPSDYLEGAEHAFHDVSGQSATRSQKAQAIRNYCENATQTDSHSF